MTKQLLKANHVPSPVQEIDRKSVTELMQVEAHAAAANDGLDEVLEAIDR